MQSYGSLQRIRCCIQHSDEYTNVTRGDRFAARGHPWRARFCDIWKKVMDLKKKFFDFHQNFMIENIFLIKKFDFRGSEIPFWRYLGVSGYQICLVHLLWYNANRVQVKTSPGHQRSARGLGMVRDDSNSLQACPRPCRNAFHGCPRVVRDLHG